MNYSKEYGCPLYIAIRLGHSELFRLMTEKLEVTNPMVKGVAECNIEIPLFGTIETSKKIEATHLHFAALFGHLEICKIIAKKIDDLNTLDLHGNTALLYAAFGGHLDVCKFIIERSKENKLEESIFKLTAS